MVEPYKEDSKNDICYGPKPYNKGGKTVQRKNNNKINDNNKRHRICRLSHK